MQANVYLFGDLGNGYTQYLDDYTKPLFKKFVTYLRANTQLFIHREDNTIYYSYIRRLTSGSSSDRYIGMCYAISGNLITDYEGLFRIFEGAITNLVTRGTILMFSSTGEVISNIGLLYKCKSEFSQISDYLQLQLGSLDSNKVFKLPPVDYSINTQEIKYFCISDPINQIQKSIGVYAYVFITKDKNYDTESLHSYSCIIKENKKIIEKLESERSDLKTECNKLKRAQKRTTMVAILAIVLVILSVCGLQLRSENEQLTQDLGVTQDELTKTGDTLNLTQTKLVNLNQLFLETKKEVASQKNFIASQKDSIEVLNEMLTSNRNIIDQLRIDIKKENGKNKNLSSQLLAKDEQINKLRTEINTLKNQDQAINPLDISMALYNFSKREWMYNANSRIDWYIHPQNKSEKTRKVLLYVYYKGRVVTSKPVDIEFK